MRKMRKMKKMKNKLLPDKGHCSKNTEKIPKINDKSEIDS